MPSTRSPCQQHASVRMSRNTAHVACGACGGRAGKWVSGEVAVHLGPPVLDKVERSWSCWRHPNASGVGVNVACAMGNTRFSQAPGDFLGEAAFAQRWLANNLRRGCAQRLRDDAERHCWPPTPGTLCTTRRRSAEVWFRRPRCKSEHGDAGASAQLSDVPFSIMCMSTPAIMVSPRS